MNAPFTAPSSATVSPDRVRKELTAILRYAQTRFTDEQLAEASGVDARAIKSYRIEGKEPSLSRALSILSALGRSDLNRILAIIGYAVRPLDESDAIPCADVVTTLMENGAVIAKAAADRRIDHVERPLCRAAADNILEAVLPLSSAGGAV